MNPQSSECRPYMPLVGWSGSEGIWSSSRTLAGGSRYVGSQQRAWPDRTPAPKPKRGRFREAGVWLDRGVGEMPEVMRLEQGPGRKWWPCHKDPVLMGYKL